MKPPTRLLDDAATELELRLLRAGAAEEPPPGALQRMADKLGVGALDPVSPAPPAAASASGPLAAGGTKLALIVVAGLAVAGGVWFAAQPATPAAPSASAPAATAPPPPMAAGARPAAAAPEGAAAATRALSEEIARLDAVRRLLASRRAAPALEALQAYQRDYPSGALRQEATLLELEGLRRAGKRARARALAERFLAENPDSPHAARVRTFASDGAHAR